MDFTSFLILLVISVVVSWILHFGAQVLCDGRVVVVCIEGGCRMVRRLAGHADLRSVAAGSEIWRNLHHPRHHRRVCDIAAGNRPDEDAAGQALAVEHDPEKWEPVFGQDHAQTNEHDPEKWAPVFGQDRAQPKWCAPARRDNRAGAALSNRIRLCRPPPHSPIQCSGRCCQCVRSDTSASRQRSMPRGVRSRRSGSDRPRARRSTGGRQRSAACRTRADRAPCRICVGRFCRSRKSAAISVRHSRR